MTKGVVAVVKEFFGCRSLLKEFNVTFIALIMKELGLHSLQDFRPISLCNFIYKIFTNILVLRLKSLLLALIANQQNGFVLSRKILDSIMMVHNNIHSLSFNKKVGSFLKLDLLKACD